MAGAGFARRRLKFWNSAPAADCLRRTCSTWSEKKFPEFFHALHYSLAERSPKLRDRLRGVLARFLESGKASSVSEKAPTKTASGAEALVRGNVRRRSDSRSPAKLPKASTCQTDGNTGRARLQPCQDNAMDERALAPEVPVIVFANEFFDALPVEILSASGSASHFRCRTAASSKPGFLPRRKNWNFLTATACIPSRESASRFRCSRIAIWRAWPHRCAQG